MSGINGLNAVFGRGRLRLLCCTRKYAIILVGIFPLTSPKAPNKILVGMCPVHPQRLWCQCQHHTALKTSAL